MQPGNRGARATVRKLGRGGSESQSCGGSDLVSGGIAQESDRQGASQNGQDGARQARANTNGPANGASPSQDRRWGTEQRGTEQLDQERLAQASAEILTALHAAKEELAKELEANLKQLKTVLNETQRIQRQMEAVLSETKSTANLQERATGGEQRPGKEERKSDSRQAQGKGNANGKGDAKGKGKAPGKEQQQVGKAGQESVWEPNPNQGNRSAATGGGRAQQSGGQQSGAAIQQGATDQGTPAWEQLRVRPGEPPTWEPPAFGNEGNGAPPPWEPPPVAQQNAPPSH